MGVVSLLSEILLLSKTTKFPFRTMDYSPWSSKNLIDQNRPKKVMQVGTDVICIYTDFGGRGLFGFGDTATFKNGQISLSTHSPWSSKNLIDRNWLKKFMQVGVDVTYMHTNFGGCDLSGFGDIATFKNGKFSLLTHVVNYIRCQYSFSILKSALRCLRGSRSKPHHIDSVDFCRVISDARLGSF